MIILAGGSYETRVLSIHSLRSPNIINFRFLDFEMNKKLILTPL